MRRAIVVGVLAWLAIVPAVSGQTRKPATKPPAPRKAASPQKPLVRPPDTICPDILGTGVSTGREFCDVLVGRDPDAGVILNFPPHRGGVVLSFDLHNRQTYSAQRVKEGKAYAHAIATIGVLTLDGGLLTRAVVETHFRGPGDLFDRVSGGAGPTGVKGVVMVGAEPVRVEIPEGIDAVSLLGEKLVTVTAEGTSTVVAPGRAIASVSGLTIEYLPPLPARRRAPVKKPPPVKKKR